MTTTYTVNFHGETGDDLGSTQIDYATMKALCQSRYARNTWTQKKAPTEAVAYSIIDSVGEQVGYGRRVS